MPITPKDMEAAVENLDSVNKVKASGFATICCPFPAMLELIWFSLGKKHRKDRQVRQPIVRLLKNE
jgi:hypothetical protein